MSPSSSLIGNAGIEQWVDQVEYQRGESHAEHDDEDDALDEEKIELADRVVEHRANPGEREDDFDQESTGEELSERESQGRRFGEEGIPESEGEEQCPVLETSRFGKSHVVLTLDRDHHAAHP